MRARDIMTRPVVTVRATTAVREAISLLTEHGFNSLPVLDERGAVVGIFSESDGLRAQTHNGTSDKPRKVRVASVMSSPVEVLQPMTRVAAIAERMLTGRLRCMPVVEEGLLIGVVSRQDVLRTLVRDDDMIEAKTRSLLADYAGDRHRWTVDVTEGLVVVSGEFADEAEQRIVTALAATIAGVTNIELRPTVDLTHSWND